MTPREYLTTIVWPNLEENLVGTPDQRRLYSAIATADALAAHIFQWCKLNAPNEIVLLADDDAYRKWMMRKWPDLAPMHNFAKAVVDLEVSKRNKICDATAAIRKAIEVYEGEMNRIGIG